MLVVDCHALEPVNLLYFVHQMVLQCLRTANFKYLVWINRTLGQLLTLLQHVTLENNHMFADRDEMLFLLPGFHIADDDRALASNGWPEIHNTIDF